MPAGPSESAGREHIVPETLALAGLTSTQKIFLFFLSIKKEVIFSATSPLQRLTRRREENTHTVKNSAAMLSTRELDSEVK